MQERDEEAPDMLARSDGERIAWLEDGAPKDAQAPEVLWCGGFSSDMTGAKATALADWGRERGRRVVRFDYFGHGQSSGAFRDGTIGRWKEDAACVQEKLLRGRHVLVGSSMGGWISLLLALQRPERVAGLLLLAPAPDFTERLLWESFSPEEKELCQRQGFLPLGDPEDEEYDENYVVTWRQIEEARQHLLPPGGLPISCPVRIIHGMGDTLVPWEHSLELAQRIGAGDIALTLVKEADHNLSEPDDLIRIQRTLQELLRAVEA